MKYNAILITLLILVTTLIVGCQKEKEMEEIPPVAIELSRRGVLLDTISTYAEISILKGNGGYKIIYPRKIEFEDGEYTGLPNEVDYSEKILKVTINENKICIERLYTERNNYIGGSFLVVDSKNQKRLFVIDGTGIEGNFYDINEVEKYLLKKPEYWLNWQ